MLATSANVRPAFESLTITSFTVPVIVPPGSPLARSAAAGPLRPLISALVIGTGGGAGEAAAEGAAAGEACANTIVVGNSHPAITSADSMTFRRRRARLMRINIIGVLLPF